MPCDAGTAEGADRDSLHMTSFPGPWQELPAPSLHGLGRDGDRHIVGVGGRGHVVDAALASRILARPAGILGLLPLQALSLHPAITASW